MVEILVPIAFFAMVFGIVYVVYTARHRQIMSMIDKGADPETFRPDPKYKMFNTLRNALFLVGIGLGIFLANILITITALEEEPVYFGMILLFGGAGLLISFLLRKKVLKEE